MEQLRYDILLLLLQGGSHNNELARRLTTNQMSVQRALKSLEADNVLQARTEGRNKVYTIKHSIESRATLLQAEAYRLKAFLRAHPELRTAIEELQTIPAPILIFGSYAKGNRKPSSDLDVYAETDNKEIRTQLRTIHSRISPHVGKTEGPLKASMRAHHVIIRGAEAFLETILAPTENER